MVQIKHIHKHFFCSFVKLLPCRYKAVDNADNI